MFFFFSHHTTTTTTTCFTCRHLVDLKYHCRAKYGPIDPIVRQPVEGRGKNGGLRLVFRFSSNITHSDFTNIFENLSFGEMERDSVLCTGASYLLQDRLHLSSDPVTIVYCKYCQNSSNINYSENVCEKHRFLGSECLVPINMPMSFHCIESELKAMHIFMRKEIEK